MLFAVIFRDKPGHGHVRQQWLDAHIRWVDEHSAVVRVAGSLRRESGEVPIGGLWIVEAESKQAIDALLRSDARLDGHKGPFACALYSQEFYETDAARGCVRGVQLQMLRVSPGSPDRGARPGRFFVIRRTVMPAALAEMGFVTGQLDAPRLADPAFRRRMAVAIATGLLNYLVANP